MTTTPPFTVTAEEADSADARELIRQLDEELMARYPQSALHGFHPAEVAGGRGVFVVARLDGRAVGCGAVRPLAPGVGEVKRMFVEPACRGRGIARQILRRLETAARGLGFAALRLETGTRQPEAVRLFEAEGYVPIPRFGEYIHDPFSVCFEKHLSPQGGVWTSAG